MLSQVWEVHAKYNPVTATLFPSARTTPATHAARSPMICAPLVCGNRDTHSMHAQVERSDDTVVSHTLSQSAVDGAFIMMTPPRAWSGPEP